MIKLPLSLTLIACAAVPLGMAAQDKPHLSTPPGYMERSYVKESVLAERDFPLLASMLNNEAVRKLLGQDAVFKSATAARWNSVAEANKSCGSNAICKTKILRVTPQQVQEVSSELSRLYKENSNLRAFVHTELKPSAVFAIDPAKPEESILIDAWVHTAANLNQIISTYGDGVPPHYNEIDSITYQAESKTYDSLITILLDDLPIEENASATQRSREAYLFFEPTLRFSLRLLQANSRDEAGRFWPLQKGENAAAVKSASSTAWKNYAYSSIVIPGAGSEVPNVSLSPWGRERVRLGVAAYRAGKAPFIMVSGGFVHPSQTPFCEALEMKKYLMEVYDIPASAILLEPYARHTTTNLRNAAREIFSYGLPADKPMLVVSDEAQVTYIASDVFLKRNRDELGYLPVTLGKRISSSEVEAFPSRQALYVDASDPLDP